MTLVEFLTWLLDEREATARKAAERDGEHWSAESDWSTESETSDLVAHHDPAWVLADVEAKRQIVKEHPLMLRDIGWLDEDREEAYEELEVCARCVPKHSHFATRADVPTGPCRTVRLLALPYAQHPDYQQEWAV